MKTKAVRIYGKNDLRLEEFELPPLAGGRDPGARDLRLHLHVQPQGGDAGRRAQARAQGRRPPPDHHRPRVLPAPSWRSARSGRRSSSRGPEFSIQPALNYKGSPGRPRLLLPLHRRRRHLRDHPQRGHGDGLPAAVHRARPSSRPPCPSRCPASSGPSTPATTGTRAPTSTRWASGQGGPWPCWPAWGRWAWAPSTTPCTPAAPTPAPPAGGDGHRRQPPGAGRRSSRRRRPPRSA